MNKPTDKGPSTPSRGWWVLRLSNVSLLVAGAVHANQGDYFHAYNYLLAIFVMAAIFGTPPPVWPKPGPPTKPRFTKDVE
jgi:hypothetical protein